MTNCLRASVTSKYFRFNFYNFVRSIWIIRGHDIVEGKYYNKEREGHQTRDKGCILRRLRNVFSRQTFYSPIEKICSTQRKIIM